VYLCFLNDDRAERHLSLVPLFEGSEALCGQRVTSGERISWVGGMHMVTCLDCRNAGMMYRPCVIAPGTAGTSARGLQRHMAAGRLDAYTLGGD
jgi:hypothetical protein